MADKAYEFGARQSPFGAQTGWNIGDNSTTTNRSRAASTNGMLDETGSKLYDERYDSTCKYTQTDPENIGTIPPVIGALVGGALLTEITIETTATDVPHMTLTGHQHDQNPHINDRRQAAHGITLDRAFGTTDFLKPPSAIPGEVIKSTCKISVQHVDEPGKTGDHADGDNYNGKINVTQEYLGDVSGLDPAIDDGTWDITSIVPTKVSGGVIKTTVTAEKAFALAWPSASSSSSASGETGATGATGETGTSGTSGG